MSTPNTLEMTVMGVRFSATGNTPAEPLAGKAVVAAAKNPGQANGNVQGQVNATGFVQGPIFRNPA